MSAADFSIASSRENPSAGAGVSVSADATGVRAFACTDVTGAGTPSQPGKRDTTISTAITETAGIYLFLAISLTKVS
jgi:hypothetical protein